MIFFNKKKGINLLMQLKRKKERKTIFWCGNLLVRRSVPSCVPTTLLNMRRDGRVRNLLQLKGLKIRFFLRATIVFVLSVCSCDGRAIIDRYPYKCHSLWRSWKSIPQNATSYGPARKIIDFMPPNKYRNKS